jgi:hypothetical protein
MVGPVDRLGDEYRDVAQRIEDADADVEDLVPGSGHPEDDVVLGRRDGVTVAAHDRLVEVADVSWCVWAGDDSPQW